MSEVSACDIHPHVQEGLLADKFFADRCVFEDVTWLCCLDLLGSTLGFSSNNRSLGFSSDDRLHMQQANVAMAIR